ncbi:MAG: prepilin-type N-terminal cleavage/methylation domain-containing protein [Candidatus Woesebacteria bacterium]|jgi:prepilin-type N-terminal cleavage/methylation domain-containing protein
MMKKFILKLPKLKKRFSNQEAGFTLIELLVVIGIIIIISTFGFASYRNFNQNQTISAAVDEFKTYLRLAKQKAQSGYIPDNTCVPSVPPTPAIFGGYRVTTQVAGNVTSIRLDAYCESGATNTYVNLKSYDLPAGVTVTAVNIIAKPLQGGFDFGAGTTELTITVTYQGSTRSFTLDRGGSITDVP